MAKIDLTKKYKSYYSSDLQPELVSIERASFLSITGKGDPGGQVFADNVQALYAVAYGVKFLSKLRERDFIVPKLEGLWSYNEMQYSGISMEEAPLKIPRSDWHYTLRLRMPDSVFKKEVSQALDVARLKKKVLPAQEIVLEEIAAHQAVQILHPGPFEKETESLQKIFNFMKEKGMRKNGRHQEIYLSDFRKTAPEKLKTILREPVK